MLKPRQAAAFNLPNFETAVSKVGSKRIVHEMNNYCVGRLEMFVGCIQELLGFNQPSPH